MCLPIHKLSHNLQIVCAIQQLSLSMELSIPKGAFIVALVFEGVGTSAFHLALVADLADVGVAIFEQYFFLCHAKIYLFIQ